VGRGGGCGVWGCAWRNGKGFLGGLRVGCRVEKTHYANVPLPEIWVLAVVATLL